MFSTLVSRYADWRRHLRTQQQLEAVDSRTLKDVGLYRRGSDDCSKIMLRTLGMR